MKKNKGLKIVILAFSVFVILIFYIIYFALEPTIMAISEVRLRSITTKALNEAVIENFSTIKYEDFITVSRDNNGNITMVQTNSVYMNKLASYTALFAQNKITSLGEQGIEVHLGTVTGIQLFSNLGPIVKIKMMPMGSVAAEFTSKFESAGINQTRHEILISIKATVRVVALNNSEVITITSVIPITETIIVGTVPSYYGSFFGNSSFTSPQSINPTQTIKP